MCIQVTIHIDADKLFVSVQLFDINVNKISLLNDVGLTFHTAESFYGIEQSLAKASQTDRSHEHKMTRG